MRKEMLSVMIELGPSPRKKRYLEALSPVPENVTSFGNRIIIDVAN